MRKIALLAATIATLVAPIHAGAAPLSGMGRSIYGGSAAFLVTKSPTLAPFSHVRFCVQNPASCQRAGSSDIVALTDAKRRQLVRVNRQVNRDIRPVNDDSSPLGDVWQINVTAGDCDDYAVTKQAKLLALGWPSGALRLAVARTSAGEGHAVLVVKTTDGDLVLDNRTNTLRPWQRAGLRWIKIQSSENPRLWLNL